MALGFGEKVQADIKRLAITERLQLLKWMQIMVDEGYYIPDFTIERRVVLDLKVVNWLDDNHLNKMIGYLAVTAFRVGLLHNFGEASFRTRRVLPPRDVAARRINYRWLFVPDSLKAASPPEDSEASND